MCIRDRFPKIQSQDTSTLKMKGRCNQDQYEDYIKSVITKQQKSKKKSILTGWLEACNPKQNEVLEKLARDLSHNEKIGAVKYSNYATINFMHREQLKQQLLKDLEVKYRKPKDSPLTKPELIFIIYVKEYVPNYLESAIQPEIIEEASKDEDPKQLIIQTKKMKDYDLSPVTSDEENEEEVQVEEPIKKKVKEDSSKAQPLQPADKAVDKQQRDSSPSTNVSGPRVDTQEQSFMQEETPIKDENDLMEEQEEEEEEEASKESNKKEDDDLSSVINMIQVMDPSDFEKLLEDLDEQSRQKIKQLLESVLEEGKGADDNREQQQQQQVQIQPHQGGIQTPEAFNRAQMGHHMMYSNIPQMPNYSQQMARQPPPQMIQSANIQKPMTFIPPPSQPQHPQYGIVHMNPQQQQQQQMMMRQGQVMGMMPNMQNMINPNNQRNMIMQRNVQYGGAHHQPQIQQGKQQKYQE
eukprot:TRINITY_DN675_c0_g1_i9.p1 TRINITY_DN675_c0_g1~~TRINITY_DN675_c0_g1_i9.p1  ORF type:complete len:466 (+),score=93.08 TRINITY_DN675_c0_g1_i9:65-1462(+)